MGFFLAKIGKMFKEYPDNHTLYLIFVVCNMIGYSFLLLGVAIHLVEQKLKLLKDDENCATLIKKDGTEIKLRRI